MLDADVIIHFFKGEMLTLLPTIFGEYDYVVLTYVYEELRQADLRNQLDRQIQFLGNIRVLEFDPKGEMKYEYAMLRQQGRGKGESACMAYCKYEHDVVGSSNLRDIKEYCEENQIVYLTTCDFLWYAWQRGKMTIEEAEAFLDLVRQKGSKLPDVDIRTYMPNAKL